MSRTARSWFVVGVIVLSVGVAAAQLYSDAGADAPKFHNRPTAQTKKTLTPEAAPDTALPRGTRPGRVKSLPELKDLRLKDDEDLAEERIERALSAPTEFDFDETPLEEVVKYFRDYHSINIWVDRAALLDDGMSIDIPLTLKLAGVRFESALNLLLEPLELDWVVQDEVLKITTRTKAAKFSETLTFDVQNLLDAGHDPDDLMAAITACIEPASWVDTEGQGSIAHSGGVLICRQSQGIQTRVAALLDDLDELAEKQLEDSDRGKAAPIITLKAYQTFEFSAEELVPVVSKMIAPDSWNEKGVGIQSVKGALLVKQTPHVHREIAKLLKQLLPPAEEGVTLNANPVSGTAGGGQFRVAPRRSAGRP
ncbi:MAG: hypothetical protein EXS05_10635 [Planctomycetaceae bacterium]|nr:hypothetical protein [Planctomycetaceae bacterium]